MQTHFTNNGRIAAILTAKAAPDDLVLVNTWIYGISLHRYYQGPAPVLALPPIGDLRFHRYDLVYKMMRSPDPIRPVLEKVERTLKNGGRVWVIGGIHFPKSDEEAPTIEPAGEGPNGGAGGKYYMAWSLQVGALIQKYTESSGRIPLAQRPHVTPYENLSLSVYQGKTAGSAPSVP